MPDNKQNTVTGYILAGGKSSRMGTDKGLMVFKGKPIIQRIIEQLQPAVEKIVIVSDNPAYTAFGLEVIADKIKDIGPAGGIYTALTHTSSPANFIVSCDMPFVTTAAIQFIINYATQAQIILPVHDGKEEPMVAVYARSCLPRWQELIRQGILSLYKLVTHFDLFKIDTSDNVLFGDSFFVNINTPEDFEKASINIHI